MVEAEDEVAEDGRELAITNHERPGLRPAPDARVSKLAFGRNRENVPC